MRRVATGRSSLTVRRVRRRGRPRPGPGRESDDRRRRSRASSFAASARRSATGRVAGHQVDPNNPTRYYVAAAAGGLWKSENRGNTWTPVFDNGGSFNLCCVVVDPKNSDIVWLGTGENSNPRSSTYRRRRSTSRPTAARRGRASASRPPSTSATSRSIRATPTSSTSRRRDRCGPPAATAASSRRPTAARRGRPC